MKPGRGRQKGNRFENEVAKIVAHAFRHFGITSTDSYRTPSSGGHRFAKKKDPGDLVISKKLRELFPFSVEVKSYGKIDLFKLFTPIEDHLKSSQFKQWLAQTCAACNGNKRLYPMLVFKQNQSVILCAIPAVYPLIAHFSRRNYTRTKMQYRGETWYVVRFDQLLKQLVREAKRNAT
jgi:hypothetical protein